MLYYYDKEKLEYVRIQRKYYFILLGVLLFSLFIRHFYFNYKFEDNKTLQEKYQEHILERKYTEELTKWELSRK